MVCVVVEHHGLEALALTVIQNTLVHRVKFTAVQVPAAMATASAIAAQDAAFAAPATSVPTVPSFATLQQRAATMVSAL